MQARFRAVGVGLVILLILTWSAFLFFENHITFQSPRHTAVLTKIFPPRPTTTNNESVSSSNLSSSSPPMVVPTAINGRISTYSFNLPHRNLIEFHNICYDTSTGHILLFTDNASDMEPFLAPNPVSRNLRILFKFAQRPTSDFETLVSTQTVSQTVLLPQERVLLFNHELPAHCLHDFLFTLFLDSPQGQPGRYYLPRKELYQSKLHECDLLRDWCCFLFSRAGVLDPTKLVSPQPTREKPLVCLNWALFPVFGRGRYAPDWTKVRPQEKLPVFDTTGFSLRHLRELHHRLVYAYDDQITQQRVTSPTSTRTNILIIDRTADRRRIWSNAPEFISFLTSRWQELSPPNTKMGSLLYYGSSFASLTPLDQARLFHRADVVISPHGAQLSNLIFGNSKRLVTIEVGCIANLTGLIPPDGLNWFGTFSTRLGMSFFMYGTDPFNRTTVCDHNERSFTIDVQGLFNFIREREIFQEKVV